MMIWLTQESGFASKVSKDLATAHGISLQFSVAQSHNSIDIGETYHTPFRKVFKKLQAREKDEEPEILLNY